MEDITKKASYCLSCKSKNCMKGCPLSNDITQAIIYVKSCDYENAYKEFLNTTLLSSICGRICPHSKQCQGSCIRGIKGESVSIGDIEAYVGDYGLDKDIDINMLNNNKVIDKKVAIIGSGPCGITCAATLKRLGVKNVTIFEKKDYLGGLLVHGIPDFRLSKDIVKKVYDKILSLGIDVKYNMELGNNITLEELRKKYDAIFIAIGANISSYMGIEGEDLDGVYGGNELLEYKKYPDFKGKKVAVIGGGNVAMDSARVAVRMGANKVKILYRRDREHMPAREIELDDAIKDGVEFKELTRVVSANEKNGKIISLNCVKTEIIDGKAVDIKDAKEFQEEANTVVFAIGLKPDKSLIQNQGIELDDWGYIKIDENGKTNLPNIYAGGDNTESKATVCRALAAGKKAAFGIMKNI